MYVERDREELLTAGQMASMNQTTKKALRLYEQKGLLIPAFVDPDTGYRYYTYKQIPLLDTIQQMQAVGFSLSEMKEVLDARDIGVMREKLEFKLEELERKAFEIEMAKHSANRLLRSCDAYESHPKFDEPALESIRRRRILRFSITPYRFEGHPTPDNPLLYQWEQALREIKQQFVDLDLPMALFHNVGCIIAKESLATREFNTIGGFVIDYTHIQTPVSTAWPEGYYLTVTIGSTVLPNGDSAEYYWLCELLDIAQKRGYALNGDYYSDMVVESPLFAYEGRDMMMKLFLPVDIRMARPRS